MLKAKSNSLFYTCWLKMICTRSIVTKDLLLTAEKQALLFCHTGISHDGDYVGTNLD